MSEAEAEALFQKVFTFLAGFIFVGILYMVVTTKISLGRINVWV